MSYIPPLTDDKEVLLEGKLQHLRMYLAMAMREVRSTMALSQADLAEKLGINQPAIAKLESHTKDHKLEPIMRYLGALGAELVIAVKHGDDIFQVSDDEEFLVVDVPLEYDDRAAELDCELRDYVHRAVEAYSAENKEDNTYYTSFEKGENSTTVTDETQEHHNLFIAA